MEDPTNYKLQVKIGQAEFNAEGPEKTVKEAFDQFLKATSALPTQAPSNQSSGKPHDQQNNGESTKIEATLLQRIFAIDAKRNTISLRLLPPDGTNRASDAAILILYGCLVLLGLLEVPVTRLIAGLRQSGIQATRLDGIMATYSHLVIKGGARIGGRYTLNNQGVTQAEHFISQFFV